MQTDERSLYELEIFSDRKSGACLLDLFVPPQTQGGHEKLSTMLHSPKAHRAEIIAIQDSLKFLIENLYYWKIGLDDRLLLNIENYLRSNIIPCQATNRIRVWIEKYRYKEVFFQLQEGINNVRAFLMELKHIVMRTSQMKLPEGLHQIIEPLRKFFANQFIEDLLHHEKLTDQEVFHHYALLRGEFKHKMREAVDQFYLIDALLSMAMTIEKYHWRFPDIQTSNSPLLEITDLYHPLLKNPQPVSIKFEPRRNLLFLTGPNMSGKTTFIKSIGIAVYLAQSGMAVPASQMTLTPFDFLITNINTEDDIRLGYSYFFSEVKRVKTIAELVRTNKRGLIISDELFKGTNIHDAYEASKSIIQGFSRWSNSIFILSSHLIELQSEIARFENIFYQFFEVNLVNGIPEYTYQLKNGISTQRLGLLILQQEGIIELLTP